MLMTSFLRDRKSTREFRDTNVDMASLNKIEREIKALNEGEKTGNWEFKLFENGKDIYQGLKDKAGYAGVMIKSPAYIALKTDLKDESIIAGAYNMEKLITFLHKMNLATCWVTLVDVDPAIKLHIFGEDYKDSDYVLAVGYEKRQNPFSKESFSERKPMEEIVVGEDGQAIDSDYLEQRGLLDLFYYIRFAPSKKNLQPWKFVVKEKTIELYMEEDQHNLTDAGIIMYYFEELAQLININSKWELSEGKKDGYIKVGQIEI